MPRRKVMIIVVMIPLSALLMATVAVGSANYYEAPMRVHPSQDGSSPVATGSSAMLVTKENGAAVSIETRLIPGNMVTVWWVVINEPGKCAASPCTSADISGNADEVQAQMVFAREHVVGQQGWTVLGAHLEKGEVSDGWYSGEEHNFDNPTGAEIHVIINDHGPEAAENMPGMTPTYGGGCDDNLPPYPESALNDGQPGPNTCRLVQYVIFQQ